MTDHDTKFPFQSRLTLKPLIKFWQRMSEADNPLQSSLAHQIVDGLKDAPALTKPISDLSVLDHHRDLVNVMMSAVFPVGRENDVYGAAIIPYETTSFYETPPFKRLKLRERFTEYFNAMLQGPAAVGRAMSAYHYVLARHYGVKVDLEYPTIISAFDEKTGLERRFKINFDAKFGEIRRRGRLKKLSDADLQRLLSDRMNLALWKEILPPSGFILEGFSVITAVDVTEQEALSALKRDLLQKDALTSLAKVDRMQKRIRALLRRPDLQLGLVSLEQNESDLPKSIRPLGRSLLLNRGVPPDCNVWGKSVYAEAIRDPQPVIIDDLEQYADRTGFEDHLLNEEGYRNLLLAPLHFEDRLVGLLELASPHPGDLDALNATKLMEATALFATAMKRSMEEEEDRIQAVIKEQYTAIHPVVEWRFQKAARNYSEALNNGTPAQIESIVFPDVYPLYGLSDIRGSSIERNAAIQADLIEQLGLALRVIVAATQVQSLPALDEVGYRISKEAVAIEKGLLSGDEMRVLDMLQQEVEPLFDRIKAFGPTVQAEVDAYYEALDPGLEVLYRQRKRFEETVMLINETMGLYIEAEEAKAQTMFPHYFEMYKTDGVDYNLYVGASLVEDGRFDLFYLHNLRLWQLMTMAGLARVLEDLKPELKVPLEVAHLILVQDLPLSIRFRQDEKQFDVDGAYNIRYEIIKKRIDKATIRGTNERLTQPGKIAIVYSQAKEAEAYDHHIAYLQDAGYLTEEVEDLELNDLQGASGLKALRVTARVSTQSPSDMPPPTLEITGDGAVHAVTEG